MVTFNARREPLSDLRVRRAMAQAIDWRTLARTTYLDVDLPDWGDIFPRSWATPFSPIPIRTIPRRLARCWMRRAGSRG